MTADGGSAQLEACTAVLLSVPRQVAERIESFLTANAIPCRIRLNTEMTPERLAQEYLGQAPGASRVLDLPLLGPLLRGRLTKDLKAEIEVVGSEISPVWDVLVRPEDLPAATNDPVLSPGTPRLNVPRPADAPPPRAPTSGAASPVVVCELPWEEAWTLSDRLNAAGIPAAVMAGDGQDRDRPMKARVVPVGVRPEDVERASAYLS